MLWVEGRFTLWLKVERPSFSTNQIVRNQEFGLSPLHMKANVQRLSQLRMNFILKETADSQRKFGSDGNGDYGREVVSYFS